MTSSTPVRPVPVVIICIYQLATLLLTLAGLALAYSVRAMRPDLAQVQTPVWTIFTTGLGIALSIAAMITLWYLRRAAFFLFAAKLLLGAGLLVQHIVHPVTSPGGLMHHGQRNLQNLPDTGENAAIQRSARIARRGLIRYIGDGVALFFLLINGVIVWYCYVLLIAPQPPALSTEPASDPRSFWPGPPR